MHREQTKQAAELIAILARRLGVALIPVEDLSEIIDHAEQAREDMAWILEYTVGIRPAADPGVIGAAPQ